MDIGDIIKDYFWVILAVLFYLFAGRKKKKPQTKEDPSVKISAPPPPPKMGLQERLEQALREMQEKVEQESRTGSSPASASAPPRQSNTAPAAPPASAGAPVPNPIGEEGVPFETVPARNPFAYASATPLHQRKTALDIALQTEQQMETEKPERFRFKEEHGLRYHTHAGEMPETRSPEFHQAHGIHYGQSPVRSHGSAVHEEDSQALFKTEEELRRAIITAEILGPPKARQ